MTRSPRAGARGRARARQARAPRALCKAQAWRRSRLRCLATSARCRHRGLGSRQCCSMPGIHASSRMKPMPSPNMAARLTTFRSSVSTICSAGWRMAHRGRDQLPELTSAYRRARELAPHPETKRSISEALNRRAARAATYCSLNAIGRSGGLDPHGFRAAAQLAVLIEQRGAGFVLAAFRVRWPADRRGTARRCARADRRAR